MSKQNTNQPTELRRLCNEILRDLENDRAGSSISGSLSALYRGLLEGGVPHDTAREVVIVAAQRIGGQFLPLEEVR